MQRLILLFGAVVFSVFAIAGTAAGQTATITLRTIDHATGPGGRFVLTASVSPGHSFGIASYSVKLLGGFTFDHLTPGVMAANGLEGSGYRAGFSLFRTTDLNTPTTGLIVSASQDTVTPTPYIYYGVGQAATHFVNGGTNGPITCVVVGDSSQDDVFRAELVIGEGTYPGEAPTIDQTSVDNGVQVFTSDNALDTTAATLVFDEVSGPPTFVEGLGIEVIAVVSFPTARDMLYEIVSIDTEGDELLVGQVAGDGATATAPDLATIPLDSSLKYRVTANGSEVAPTIKIAPAVSFETMVGKLYELIAFNAAGEQRVVGRATGDGSTIRIPDPEHLSSTVSKLYRVARLN